MMSVVKNPKSVGSVVKNVTPYTHAKTASGATSHVQSKAVSVGSVVKTRKLSLYHLTYACIRVLCLVLTTLPTLYSVKRTLQARSDGCRVLKSDYTRANLTTLPTLCERGE